MTTESFRSMYCMLKGCIGVLRSFKLDGLKGLSCISHSRFSGSDAFSSPSSLLAYFEVPALGVFCSVRHIVCSVRIVFFCYFSSLSVFSLVSHPFLSLSLLLLCSFYLIFSGSKFAFHFHFVFHCLELFLRP